MFWYNRDHNFYLTNSFQPTEKMPCRYAWKMKMWSLLKYVMDWFVHLALGKWWKFESEFRCFLFFSFSFFSYEFLVCYVNRKHNTLVAPFRVIYTLPWGSFYFFLFFLLRYKSMCQNRFVYMCKETNDQQVNILHHPSIDIEITQHNKKKNKKISEQRQLIRFRKNNINLMGEHKSWLFNSEPIAQNINEKLTSDT